MKCLFLFELKQRKNRKRFDKKTKQTMKMKKEIKRKMSI